MSQTETVTINQIKYIIKNKHDIIESFLLKRGQWNNNIVLLIGGWIKKYNLKHFFNAGSHIGTVALPISKYINKVTAIEPFPPTYNHLLEHIKLNNIKNINTINIALGEKEEIVYFLDHKHNRIKNNTGGIHAITKEDIEKKRLSSNLHNKKYNSKMKRIDNLSLDKFDIMLLDVEGREYEVFKGGSDKINKYKPIIITEIWGNSKRDLENIKVKREEVINYIIGLNYKLVKQLGDNFIFFPKHLKI